MMRYQKIESKIWHDEKFLSLSPMQQRLFFYILTCPHNNLTGLFVLKPGYACDDLTAPNYKCLTKDFEKDLRNLIEKGLIEYDFQTSVLLIKNFLKHNPITNPNQKIAVGKELLNLPKSPLIQRFLELNPELCKGLKEGLEEVLLKPETETETETETEGNINAPSGKPSAPTPSFFSCTYFSIDFDYRQKLITEYPLLDDQRLTHELSKMEDWLSDNKQRKKFGANGKMKNPKLFIKNWLDKLTITPEAPAEVNEPKGYAGIRDFLREG